MAKDIPMGNLLQLYTYAGTLAKMKENKKAYDIYKLAFDKYPDDGYAVLGMIRGSFAIGDTKQALRYAEKALTIWKDSNSKAFINKMVDDIKNGKDINK